MLEVFGQVTCPNDGLRKLFGAFGFLVDLSDMVWQSFAGDLLPGVGEGLQAYLQPAGVLHFHTARRVGVLYPLQPAESIGPQGHRGGQDYPLTFPCHISELLTQKLQVVVARLVDAPSPRRAPS